ncbi:MAG: polyprenyl synthetase family protein [Solirubrobacteraceae bacterium]
MSAVEGSSRMHGAASMNGGAVVGGPVLGGPVVASADGLGEIMARGGAALRARMAAIERNLEQVTAAAGAPLAVHAAATVRSGGKRLRPLLVVLAAEAAGGPRESEDGESALVRAATAVELVHSATLVHDDVIDGAQLRRGSPTVVRAAGRVAAVATGDLLFSRAFAELARNGEARQLRVLSEASSALAAGEMLQREDAYAREVSVSRYLRRCELKTAALFEAACRLGALVGRDGSTRLAEELGAFARRIGLAFQLLDDVLDVAGSVQDTGKPRGTDLLDGTVTLPLILAREHDQDLAAEDLAKLAGPDDAESICRRIAATGALQDAQRRALQIVATAKAELPSSLPPSGSALLDLVADAVVERYR